jgi:hypothetical protein
MELTGRSTLLLWDSTGVVYTLRGIARERANAPRNGNDIICDCALRQHSTRPRAASTFFRKDARLGSPRWFRSYGSALTRPGILESEEEREL